MRIHFVDIIRVLLLRYWKKDPSTRDSVKEICSIESEGKVTKSTASDWFQYIKHGDFILILPFILLAELWDRVNENYELYLN